MSSEAPSAHMQVEDFGQWIKLKEFGTLKVRSAQQPDKLLA